MNTRRETIAIAGIALSFMVAGCNQLTQDLYKVEVERSCQGCDLRGVDFSYQSLGSKYRISISNQPLSTDPQGLGHAKPVDLTGSDLRETNFSHANLTAVVLNQTRLNDANLSQANLTEAQLVDADLRGANLQGANLTEANFQSADLTGADLRDSDLSTANLAGADLTDALLDQP
jgi:uncharacterized protein YjbI with pentapeptide repeats